MNVMSKQDIVDNLIMDYNASMRRYPSCIRGSHNEIMTWAKINYLAYFLDDVFDTDAYTRKWKTLYMEYYANTEEEDDAD